MGRLVASNTSISRLHWRIRGLSYVSTLTRTTHEIMKTVDVYINSYPTLYND